MQANPTCDSLIVSCIDFRTQEHVRSWAEQHLSRRSYDYVGLAGSSKDLAVILSQVEIAVRLHRIKRVILVHHEDCGAYGAHGSFENHAADLRRAKQEIATRYPHLIVDTLFLTLTGEFLPVD